MTEQTFGVEMDADAITRFLHDRGTGVLSLASGGTAYGVPVSFGYDEPNRRCALLLGFGEDSRKRRFIESTAVACLTAYEWRSPVNWRSVIATGPLERIQEEAFDEEGGPAHAAASSFLTWARTVSVNVFEQNVSDVDFRWYELSIEGLTGRRAPPGGGPEGPEA